MNETIVRNRLFEAYQNALSDPHHQFTEEEATDLSGVFLPDVTAAYCASPIRLLLVGQETKGWNGAFEHFRPDDSFELYRQKPFTSYATWMTCAPKKIRFLQFHRSLCKRVGGEVLWANVFAMSHNKASPVGHRSISKIQSLSARLLKDQVEILKPHGILFTTGWRYDRFLTDFFGEKIHQSNVVEPKALWQFRIDDTLCFRTSHPRYATHNAYREMAISSLLNLHNQLRSR